MEFSTLEEYAEYYCSKKKLTKPEAFVAGYNLAFNAINQQHDFEIWKCCLDHILSNKGIMQSFMDEDTRENAGKAIRHLTEELFLNVTQQNSKSKKR